MVLVLWLLVYRHCVCGCIIYLGCCLVKLVLVLGGVLLLFMLWCFNSVVYVITFAQV